MILHLLIALITNIRVYNKLERSYLSFIGKLMARSQIDFYLLQQMNQISSKNTMNKAAFMFYCMISNNR